MSEKDKREIYLEFIDTLKKLHEIPILEGYGPKTFDYCKRQVMTWSRQYQMSKTSEIPTMDQLTQQLFEDLPKQEKLTIIHGDYKLDNVIFHPKENKILAVIDWELSTIGDPLCDLGYFAMSFHLPKEMPLRVNEGKGIPQLKELTQRYSQKPVENLNYFIAFSLFRLAAIAQGVYKRGLDGNASQKEQSLMYKFVPGLLSKEGVRLIRKWNDILEFLEKYVVPREHEYHSFVKTHCSGKPCSEWKIPPIMEEWKKEAKKRGYWNFFKTMSNFEYAKLCEAMVTISFLSPEIFNCSAPDTGNMEVLEKFGSEELKKKWLEPLLNGEIRSCFGMTEPNPNLGSSDATNIECSIERVDNYYIINGKKWWISGAGDPRCKVCILMGKTDPKNKNTYRQQSMIVVPMDTPGVKVIKALNVFGTDDAPIGHCEMEFVNVKVPLSNILLGEGRGFEIAQERLGPGRIHHCMRLIGVTEYALRKMVERAKTRSTFGKKLIEHQVILHAIAEARIELDQARLLVLKTAESLDRVGNVIARKEIAMIKVIVPRMAQRVIDRCIQTFGAGGFDNIHLSHAFIAARTIRIADGPDEVHLNTIGNLEIKSKL